MEPSFPAPSSRKADNTNEEATMVWQGERKAQLCEKGSRQS